MGNNDESLKLGSSSKLSRRWNRVCSRSASLLPLKARGSERILRLPFSRWTRQLAPRSTAPLVRFWYRGNLALIGNAHFFRPTDDRRQRHLNFAVWTKRLP
jgi:hypothetical protein